MPLILTYKNLNSYEFNSALEALANRNLPVKTSYSISKIKRNIHNYMEEGKALFIKILKEHCELDEKGNVKTQMSPEVKEADKVIEASKPIPGTYIVKPDMEESFKKKLEDFMSIECPIEVNKITLQELSDEKVSANLLANLDPIITDLSIIK